MDEYLNVDELYVEPAPRIKIQTTLKVARQHGFVAGEKLIGEADGRNRYFELPDIAYAHTVQVFINDRLLHPGVGYTTDGVEVVFTQPPRKGSVLICNYIKH